MRALRAAFAFVGALPWVRSVLALSVPASVGRAIDGAFLALCHHAPERTLSLHGAAMTVCSRCAGVYGGLLLAAATPLRVPSTWAKRALLAGAALMAADVASQDLELHAPSHVARLLTGAWVGWAAAAWMLSELTPTQRARTARLSRAVRSASRKAISASAA